MSRSCTANPADLGTVPSQGAARRASAGCNRCSGSSNRYTRSRGGEQATRPVVTADIALPRDRSLKAIADADKVGARSYASASSNTALCGATSSGSRAGSVVDPAETAPAPAPRPLYPKQQRGSAKVQESADRRSSGVLSPRAFSAWSNGCGVIRGTHHIPLTPNHTDAAAAVRNCASNHEPTLMTVPSITGT
jgi:hypothetical protein